MNYMEYMVMLGYRIERELRDKKVNEPYRLNREAAEERPQRHSPPRFWWHYDPNKPERNKNHIL